MDKRCDISSVLPIPENTALTLHPLTMSECAENFLKVRVPFLELSF